MIQIADVLTDVYGAEIPLKDGEYINQADNLIYCARCNTPRQLKVQLQDRTLYPRIRCTCQRQADAEATAARQAIERQWDLDRMRSVGLQDPAYRAYTFAADNGCNPDMHRAYRYVANWPQLEPKGIGMLLWGSVGTGKTYMAGCIANALLDQGVSVTMTSIPRILHAMGNMYPDQRGAYIRDLNQYRLLVLDDLGAERSTEYALEQVYNVIDCRYRSGKPLIITTNLSLEEMQNPTNIGQARIYDRILERCVPVSVNRVHIRQQLREDNLAAVRDILG